MVTLFGSTGWDLGKGIGSSQNEILGLGTWSLGLEPSPSSLGHLDQYHLDQLGLVSMHLQN
jgi:hypothetical protein